MDMESASNFKVNLKYCCNIITKLFNLRKITTPFVFGLLEKVSKKVANLTMHRGLKGCHYNEKLIKNTSTAFIFGFLARK